QEVAREFNLGVIIFIPLDPHATDIIANVTKKISQTGLSIRQALAEDPDLSTQAKLTIIVDGEIPPELISEIRKLEGTRSVTVY
ncbi:MAG: hypothetical protein JSV35_02685, partial [Candidatus Bathyarchaeota archaeon]